MPACMCMLACCTIHGTVFFCASMNSLHICPASQRPASVHQFLSHCNSPSRSYKLFAVSLGLLCGCGRPPGCTRLVCHQPLNPVSSSGKITKQALFLAHLEIRKLKPWGRGASKFGVRGDNFRLQVASNDGLQCCWYSSKHGAHQPSDPQAPSPLTWRNCAANQSPVRALSRSCTKPGVRRHHVLQLLPRRQITPQQGCLAAFRRCSIKLNHCDWSACIK